MEILLFHRFLIFQKDSIRGITEQLYILQTKLNIILIIGKYGFLKG